MAERVANRRLRLASMWVVSFVLVGVYLALPGGDESVAIEAPSTNLEPRPRASSSRWCMSLRPMFRRVPRSS